MLGPTKPGDGLPKPPSQQSGWPGAVTAIAFLAAVVAVIWIICR